MSITTPNGKTNIKHPTIIDEETGQERSMTWTEWIEFVIKPQINKHKENYSETQNQN